MGAHRLRHTAATELLRAGAPLSEVGQVLRHRSTGTTAIYAKVDQGALGAWPGRAGRCGMTELATTLEVYLTVRRSLGYKLERAGRLLADFVAFSEREGADTVTTELAVRWATLPGGASVGWWAQRLGVVRGFAGWLQALDPSTRRLQPAHPPSRPAISIL
ncbi:MAG TPA: tyrosine-type recombinase/integrase [Actinomycetes bacterium]|nr:tyrosine-type recombinase/integrase [Actinomycetes bacterium]